MCIIVVAAFTAMFALLTRAPFIVLTLNNVGFGYRARSGLQRNDVFVSFRCVLYCYSHYPTVVLAPFMWFLCADSFVLISQTALIGDRVNAKTIRAAVTSATSVIAAARGFTVYEEVAGNRACSFVVTPVRSLHLHLSHVLNGHERYAVSVGRYTAQRVVAA